MQPASKNISDLLLVLDQLTLEHRRLVAQFDAQQQAMKSFAIDALESVTKLQDGTRIRIAHLETRRRGIVAQLSRLHRKELTLAELARLYAPEAGQLLKKRNELKEVVSQLQSRTHIASRLAGAVLGHMNTVVRLIAGAVERAGVYTRDGVPKVSSRIGVMEAVG
jgi:hypothetical protein